MKVLAVPEAALTPPQGGRGRAYCCKVGVGVRVPCGLRYTAAGGVLGGLLLPGGDEHPSSLSAFPHPIPGVGMLPYSLVRAGDYIPYSFVAGVGDDGGGGGWRSEFLFYGVWWE